MFVMFDPFSITAPLGESGVRSVERAEYAIGDDSDTECNVGGGYDDGVEIADGRSDDDAGYGEYGVPYVGW